MAVHSTRASVGEPAPKFALPDGTGHIVALDELLANGPVVVVFLRGFA
jgi:peroxiredoxin